MQTFTPIQYLKIDIASNFGLDKETWDTRLEWFEEYQDDLDNLVGEAEEPALFYAGVQAWKKAQRGESITYPVGLDATASGAQLLSILIGCEKSARLCNVIDTGDREDLYHNIYHVMREILAKGDLSEAPGDDVPIANSKIDRSMIKKAIMTSLYGSTAMPKKVFGEGELLDTFHAVMTEHATGIWELNKDLLGLWQPDALSHDWVMPDNFYVKVKTMVDKVETFHFLNAPHELTTKINAPAESGLSIPANVTHSLDGMVVREMGRRCDYDAEHVVYLTELIMQSSYIRNPRMNRNRDRMVMTLWHRYLDSGFLSARILYYLDEYNLARVDYSVILKLILSLPMKPFKILTVHDRFSVHPNYANDLRWQYNQILQDIADSEMLAFIVEQIIGHRPNVLKYDDLSGKILTANYALS